MSVASFPAPVAASGGGGSPEIYSVQSGTNLLQIDGMAGIYTIKIWSKTYATSPTGSVTFANSAGSVVATGTLVDPDSGASQNPLEVTLRVTEEFSEIYFLCNQDGWFSIIRDGDYQQGSLLSLVTYSSSQSLTFASDTKAILIGGGGNGGPAYPGGGGGSGYLSVMTIPSGTFSLIAGGVGGTSSINGVSASGGSSSSSSSGASGGSGGGGASSGFGRAGGFNGANGGAGNGGGGSQETFPFWATPGSGGVGADQTASGGAGGVYAGGGGGRSYGGVDGTGGGGGGALAASGRGGGAGGLIVLVGA